MHPINNFKGKSLDCNFLRTRVRYFWYFLLHWDEHLTLEIVFFVSLSGEMVREKIVRQTKPAGVAGPGCSQTNHFHDNLTRIKKGLRRREKPLVAGEERMLCSLLESKSPLRSVCQLQRLNWIWKCLHGEKQLIYVSREV